MLSPSQSLDSHQLSTLSIPCPYQILFHILNTNIAFLFHIWNISYTYKKSEPLNTVRKYSFVIEVNVWLFASYKSFIIKKWIFTDILIGFYLCFSFVDNFIFITSCRILGTFRHIPNNIIIHTYFFEDSFLLIVVT